MSGYLDFYSTVLLQNFQSRYGKSALKGARTTEAWTATGVDGLIEAALFVCNYPLRAIVKHFRRAGAL